MTFSDALDDLERRLVAVETALDAGEVPVLPGFVPAPLEGPPVDADRVRFAALLDRLELCRERLLTRRSEMLHELAGLDRRRDAASAYAGVERRA